VTTTLKPCPFCGGEVELERDNWDDADGWTEPPVIWCPNCLLAIGIPDHMHTEQEFLDWWNTRAEKVAA